MLYHKSFIIVGYKQQILKRAEGGWGMGGTKLIFKRFFLILPIKFKFTFSNNFYKQINGYAMGGLLCVTFSSTYKVKLNK